MRFIHVIFIMALFMFLCACSVITNKAEDIPSETISEKITKEPSENRQEENEEREEEIFQREEPVVEEISITLSAAGDVTLGRDENYEYTNSFDHEAEKNGLHFFTQNIESIFKNDDFTTVNLETTLTTSTRKAAKKFRFRGDPSYAKILTLAGIEAVNLANNHTYDYLQTGYEDTIANLKKENIGYFGDEHKLLAVIKGVKIGALGYKGWVDDETIRAQISNDIRSLREEGANIVLVHFHWGEERSYVPNETQKSLGRFTIDSGADLVVGHHPHVVQGIEEYKGKFIVYSLGNFMFGGNKNPSDKDTFVFQQTFYFKGGELTDRKEINVIPFSISSVPSRNNYQPTPLVGAEAERIKRKIIDLSAKISGTDWVVYETKNSELSR
ncbi:CapA family protein [Bacillus alveayuensis]|uniref:CapA family protein n=1 Tax=Aeribacillus alveayuensis TaxID=279215 RepID=UPI000AA94812|nr:CapA family protein [Bacillus alveayuensis]